MEKSGERDDATQVGNPLQYSGKIPERLQASVVIIDGKVKGMEYTIAKTYTLIGRDKSADIAPPDSHISRRHAVVVFLDGNYILTDLGSMNGTVMNGALIKQANLRHGDKFRVGETTFQFILQENFRNQTYDIS